MVSHVKLPLATESELVHLVLMLATQAHITDV